MITYQAYLTTHTDPIKDISDETVQKACADWFKYRYLGFDNVDKFTDIFRRNVTIYYPMYTQKLRIEPGVSEYDWLVQSYREAEHKQTGTNSSSTKHGNDTVTASGNSTSETSMQHGHIIDNTNSNTTNGSTTDNGTDVRSGGHSSEHVDGLTTTTASPHVTVRTQNGGNRAAYSGDQQVASNTPMSKKYSTMIEPDKSVDESADPQHYQKAYQHMPALDWETLSAQQQSGHREYTNDNTYTDTEYIYKDGVEGDVTKTEGDKDSPTTDKLTYNDETDTHKNTQTREDKSSGTGKTINSGTDVNTTTGNTGSTTEHAFGNVEISNDSSNTIRDRETGRNEDPATLLEKATAFIEHSSAFMWLKEQLDSCFYPGFYTDDENEGSALI